MADAISRKKARREYHLARIEHIRETKGNEAALDAAIAYFKAERAKCPQPALADRISYELFLFLIEKAEKFSP